MWGSPLMIFEVMSIFSPNRKCSGKLATILHCLYWPKRMTRINVNLNFKTKAITSVPNVPIQCENAMVEGGGASFG